MKSGTLPSPGVRFDDCFLDRLGRLALRVSSGRDRREGAGRAGLLGGGSEFLGFRPYRPGEDLRRLDWNLYARHRRPFVRLTRRESSERWAVLLDDSASMGVGRPGKLQLAAEVAMGIFAAAQSERVEVELHRPGAGAAARLAGGAQSLGRWKELLEATRAAGEEGLATLVREPARFRDAEAVFLIGDLQDLEPAEVLQLTRRGRDLTLVQILAPEERDPSMLFGDANPGAVRWSDAESESERTVLLDASAIAAYGALLSAQFEVWRAAAGRHRVSFTTVGSDAPFETVVEGLFSS